MGRSVSHCSNHSQALWALAIDALIGESLAPKTFSEIDIYKSVDNYFFVDNHTFGCHNSCGYSDWHQVQLTQ